MLAPDDITIDRLQVRASPERAQVIAGDLERGSWPVAETSDWVFVRQLSLTAPAGQVRREAALSLDRALAGAVDGRSAGAEAAPAVRFQSLPDLLATLVADWLAGRAAHKWYWARWDYLWRDRTDRALSRLLWEYALYLPAVTRALAEEGQLPALWRQLSPSGAEQLVAELSRVCALSPPAAPASTGSSPTVERALAYHAGQSFWRHRRRLHAWLPALTGLRRDDPRWPLAALIAGLEFCPLLLTRDSGAVVSAFMQSVQALSAASRPERPAPGGQLADRGPGPDSVEAGLEAAPEGTAAGLEEALKSSPTAGSRPGPDSSSSTGPEAGGGQAPDGPSVPPKAGTARELAPSPATATESGDLEPTEVANAWAAGSELATTSGGFFYLVNALSGRACQALLREAAGPDLPSGWLWLVDMARRLGGELDPALAHFVALQAGYDDAEAMAAELPLAYGEPVFEALCAHYGECDCWGPDLLAAPAEVVASPSHIDVYYPLSAVDLSVRRAGLDLNPGWVPWLGRVLMLHYREFPLESGP